MVVFLHGLFHCTNIYGAMTLRITTFCILKQTIPIKNAILGITMSCVIMVSVIMLSVIMLNVVKLSVMVLMVTIFYG